MLPFYFVYNPGLLLKGPPLDIAIDTAAALCMLTAMIFAFDGSVLNRKANPLLRLLLLGCAIAIIFPPHAIKLSAMAAIIVLSLAIWKIAPLRHSVAEISRAT